VKFYQLAQIFSKLEKTSSRLEMTDILHKMIKLCTPLEVEKVLYLVTGRVVPKYVSLEFNMAEKMVMKSLSLCFSLEESDVKKLYKEKGDLGIVAEYLSLKESSGKKDMLVNEVFERLKIIAQYRGKESQSKKIEDLSNLLKTLKSISCKYVVRIILGTLRLGIGEKTIIDSLSWVVKGDKSLRKKIERAYYLCSDLGYVGRKLVEDGVKGLDTIVLIPGRPISPELSQREKSAEAIISRLKRAIIQPKLDGLRCQLHKWVEKGKPMVALFSRNLEVLTHMFPEVVKGAEMLEGDSFILDGELVGYREETGEFIPFQQTIQRRRKYDIEKKAGEIPVSLFCFDLMYLNGEDLTLLPYRERLNKLERLIPQNFELSLKVVESNEVSETKEVQKLFDTYVSAGLEGLMAKSPTSQYQPGVRNYDWIKLRRSYEVRLADTIDGVILGYYKGRGKLTKFGIGAFLVGIYNEEKDEFQTIAKVGTGVKEDEWEEIKTNLDKIKVDHLLPRVNIAKELMPDVLVYPQIVVVIRADEITRSPLHTAGKEGDESGFALRFPRLEKFNRPDKTVDEITTVKEIIEMYQH